MFFKYVVANADALNMFASRKMCDCLFLETVEEKALSLGAMDVLKEYLDLHASDEGLVQMVLLSVDSLTDTGQVTKIFID